LTRVGDGGDIGDELFGYTLIQLGVILETFNNGTDESLSFGIL
jgi:hypothetical protein